MKYAKNLYLWMLMSLTLGGGAARAQSKTDTAYDRTMMNVRQMDRVKIDTVNIPAPGIRPQPSITYNLRTDSITVPYFVETYDTIMHRDLGLVRDKKHVRNDMAHIMRYRANNRIRDHLLFQDIDTETRFSIYNEVSAHLAALIERRHQFQEIMRDNMGKFTLTDDFGNHLRRVPAVYKEKITDGAIYTTDFRPHHDRYDDYFLYTAYIAQHPNVLCTDSIGRIEADCMLMCALTRMAGAPDYYAATFAAPRPIPESQRLLYLYTMLSGLKIGDYTELDPMDFAPEFRKIGYDTEPLVPRYRPVMDILDNRPDLIPDTVRTLDSVRPDMFTYDGINFWDKLSDRARDTLESHVQRHMAATTDYARMHSGCEQNRVHHDQHLRWMDKMYAKIIIFRHIRAVTDNFRRQTRHPESIRITIHPAYRQWER